MTTLYTILPMLYQLVGALLIIYGLFVFSTVILFLYHRRRHDWILTRHDENTGGDWPVVTIQVPIYNEPHVARRVIGAVARLDYPRERLQIQILDDSTDHTASIVNSLVERWRRATNLDISACHRSQRQGFKAGALAAALPTARGEFIAIFDADFAPQAEWLRKTIPILQANPRLAFVQTRWGHLNRDQNPITAAQGLALDGHFVVEQQARSAAGYLQNFNGSGGIWRREAIVDAGGWTSDTVTEDLDLSYRAQLRGWQGSYVQTIEAPAELPPLLVSFKRQQRRWAKGSSQTFRKLAGSILRSHLSLSRKIYALLHLGGYATHLPLITLLFLTLPLALLPDHQIPLPFVGYVSSIVSIAPFVMYGLAQHKLDGWSGLRRLRLLPFLALISLGLSPTIARAVGSGLRSDGGPFERTPKQGEAARHAAMPEGEGLRQLWPETLTFMYALLTLLVIVWTEQWQLALLPILYGLGCGLVLVIGFNEYTLAARRVVVRHRLSDHVRSGDAIPN